MESSRGRRKRDSSERDVLPRNKPEMGQQQSHESCTDLSRELQSGKNQRVLERRTLGQRIPAWWYLHHNTRTVDVQSHTHRQRRIRTWPMVIHHTVIKRPQETDRNIGIQSMRPKPNTREQDEL